MNRHLLVIHWSEVRFAQHAQLARFLGKPVIRSDQAIPWLLMKGFSMLQFKRVKHPYGSWQVFMPLAILGALYFALSSSNLPIVLAQPDRNSSSSITHGELVFVPIYSSIFYENHKQTLDLAATLSVHNINPDSKVTITRVDYYDTEGRLLKKYLEKSVVLNALQTKNFIVEKSDTKGGAGANFLVEWQSAAEISSPLIEAVMINAASNLGIAFTTSGKVVRQISAAAK